MFYLRLPLIFIKFWFIEAPRSLIVYFASINSALLQLFSLPLLVNTYFKPWKNEYRKGFVATAIFIGIVIKTCAIFADLILLVFILVVEIIFVLGFILWPIWTIGLLFA